MILFNVFENKTILITGHTGFKGSWLAIWLKLLGAHVVGLSKGLTGNPSNFGVSRVEKKTENFFEDIRNLNAVEKIIRDVKPDFIFHLAAQALVSQSYKDPLKTFSTNAIGTANILHCLLCLEKPVVCVMITSDKVYDNIEWPWGYRETDALGGKDPYSASKGMAELAIRSYLGSFLTRSKNNIKLGIARAGNVIGGGDWAEDRIVPDCVKAWAHCKKVNIRNPNATRPWQHVLEPLSGYLTLASALFRGKVHGEAFNFGPSNVESNSVKNLIVEMSKHWKNVKWENLSKEKDDFHEAALLKLNCDKAYSDLNWVPVLRFEENIQLTVEWYKEYYDDQEKPMDKYSIAQIEKYMSLASERLISWATKI